MQSLSRRSPEGAGAQLHEPRIHHGGSMGDCLHGRLTTGGLPISGGLWSSVWEGGRRGRRPANLQRAPASAQGARRRPTPPHLLCTSGLVREREPRQGKGRAGPGKGGAADLSVEQRHRSRAGRPAAPPPDTSWSGLEAANVTTLEGTSTPRGFTTFGSKDVPPSLHGVQWDSGSLQSL